MMARKNGKPVTGLPKLNLAGRYRGFRGPVYSEGMPRIQLLAPAWLLPALAVLSGCSSPPPPKPALTASPYGPGPAATSGKHPLAKYIELAGFRLTLEKGGQLKIKFSAINHSDADLPDLGVHVRIITTATKEGEPPVTEFDAMVPGLGPHDDHDVEAMAATQLKAYEFPDWQFLRADFDITSPAP